MSSPRLKSLSASNLEAMEILNYQLRQAVRYTEKAQQYWLESADSDPTVKHAIDRARNALMNAIRHVNGGV